jgi:hypothetical protein
MSESAVVQHSQEIVSVLSWVIVAGGGLFLGLIAWIGNRLFEELKGIKEQIQETNRTLSAIEKDLRNDLTHLDRRLTVLETRCNGHHQD